MDEERTSCKFLKCFAGGGIAGNGHCFLGGDPQDKNCPKFEDEEEKLEEWRLRDQRMDMERNCSICGYPPYGTMTKTDKGRAHWHCRMNEIAPMWIKEEL